MARTSTRRRCTGSLRDTEESYVDRVAFVVPNETTWPLPLYELALMTARQARAWAPTRPAPARHPRGRAARDLRRRRRATPSPSCSTPPHRVHRLRATREVEHGHLIVDPGGRSIDVDRVVSLPRLEGLRISGVPADAEGFIPVDAYGRVPGSPGVYAAGDGTAFPIKQGGLATQQADAVAETIAAAPAHRSSREPFKPVLRGMLLTGRRRPLHALRRGGRPGRARLRDHALWWPPAKIASRYLAPFLFGRDEVATIEHIRGDHLAVEADFASAGDVQDARIAVS